MAEIIPALLAPTFEELKRNFELLQPFQGYWHVDVMDGKFVPRITYHNASEVGNLLGSRFEVHMMVEHPLLMVQDWIEAGAERVLFHIESKDDPVLVIRTVKNYYREVGIILKPETPWRTIEAYLASLDVIGFLAVHPGASGQVLLPEVLGKIQEFHQQYSSMPFEIDGGLTLHNAVMLLETGAACIVTASAIFKRDDPIEVLKELQALCHTYMKRK